MSAEVSFARYMMEAVEEMTKNGSIPASASFLTAMRMAGEQLSLQWGRMAASTAPVWRVITMTNPVWSAPMGTTGGSSVAATVQGLGALGIAGVCIAVAAGVWVALGAGYYEARQRVRKQGYMRGFSQGFTMGVLNWQWPAASARFGMRRVIYTNNFDPGIDRIEAVAFNEGLVSGFSLGSSGPEENKKKYRIALRKLAKRTDTAPWSRDEDLARAQQVDYVVALAGAGVKSGLLVAE